LVYYYCARAQRLKKKLQNGNRQGMSKAIQHALTIAHFTIDRPALLEINRKIGTMGGRGGDSHRGQKRASLCLASVCFLGFFGVLRKK
jgi:hypothetical protein